MNDERMPDPVVGDRFVDAVRYAVELHRTQARKATTIPYVTHLFAVCSLALEDGASEDEAIAALLHDGPEDQGGQPVLDAIRDRFGDRVAEIVYGLTDTLESPKPEWQPRKEAYLRRLAQEPPEVLRVSLADKLHNLRSIATDGEAVWDRFNAEKSVQAWYFGKLLDVFEEGIPRSRNLPEFRDLVYRVFGPWDGPPRPC